MKKHLEYIENIKNVIAQIEETCEENIEKTAAALSSALIDNRRIYLFGTGHSHMLSEELFYRAGGLLNIQPVLIDTLMLHIDAAGSTIAEREEGLADKIFDDYNTQFTGCSCPVSHTANCIELDTVSILACFPEFFLKIYF